MLYKLSRVLLLVHEYFPLLLYFTFTLLYCTCNLFTCTNPKGNSLSVWPSVAALNCLLHSLIIAGKVQS